MELVRAVRIDDLDELLKLVRSATRGLTSLQLNREQLLDRIEQSVFAFSRSGVSSRDEPYVLVMVDRDSGEIVGTSTVYAKTGGHQAFYAYRRVATDHQSDQLNVQHHRESLSLYRTHDGPSEIGSLFLRGKYRGNGRGRWLSLSRFMLIAERPHRFEGNVIAEMRGRAEPDGRVPFWEAVTGRFIPVEFSVADAMSTMSKDFIEQMMPQHPIYLDLLPDEIRAGLGQVHAETKPALAMLRDEGFSETDMIDIFDAGPIVRCQTKQINAVQRCKTMVVDRIVADVGEHSQPVIVASEKNGFTSVLTAAICHENWIEITRDDAEVLGLERDSRCLVLPPRPR